MKEGRDKNMTGRIESRSTTMISRRHFFIPMRINSAKFTVQLSMSLSPQAGADMEKIVGIISPIQAISK
jgi:hypothetical protein